MDTVMFTLIIAGVALTLAALWLELARRRHSKQQRGFDVTQSRDSCHSTDDPQAALDAIVRTCRSKSAKTLRKTPCKKKAA